MKKILIASILVLAACGKTNNTYVSNPVAQPAPETTVQQQIDTIIAENNGWRESLGQTALTSGLSCSVQAVSSGQYLSSSSPGYTAGAGVLVVTGPSYSYLLNVGFDQPESNAGPNNVIDPSIQPLFLSNNYKINCSGQLVVTEDGYHSFQLSSDDGAILTIDGTQVINNDGQHGITTASGTKSLQSVVVHTLNLQYAQSGAGQFALILQMDGSVLPAANLYH